MIEQEIKDKINYLIEVKGVSPIFFWKQVGQEKSVFCRWRHNERSRNLTQDILERLELVLNNY